ncbi:hypothetical protein HDU99_003778, partial [Rhizoclosmatium hyalinum]
MSLGADLVPFPEAIAPPLPGMEVQSNSPKKRLSFVGMGDEVGDDGVPKQEYPVEKVPYDVRSSSGDDDDDEGDGEDENEAGQRNSKMRNKGAPIPTKKQNHSSGYLASAASATIKPSGDIKSSVEILQTEKPKKNIS